MEKPHKKLIAWQKAMDLVATIYELTRKLPREEVYGLSSQLRRAAVSVPSNIAEGAAGQSATQFRNYLSVAIGSLNELATQLEIVWRIRYLDRKVVAEVEMSVDECLAVTYGLRKSLK
ncbi:MAG TPA: four helix bundle protein [Pyrinomonadaceae bacterium]|nr:four helix bundle protein [Pyrinomonadaceae bacterium]